MELMMTERNINNHSVIDIRDEGESLVSENELISEQNLSENKDEAELVSLIQGKIPQKFPDSDESCIFRVPDKLLRQNEKAFVPNLVSIGPFHHGEKKLQAMEEIKLWMLGCFLDQKPNRDTILGNFVKEIRSIEQFCRDCYDETFGHLSSDKFVEIMVVDGCFIIELFRISEDYWLRKENPIFTTPGMLPTIRLDVLLLENQLPWKVLDCLFELTRSGKDRDSKSRLNYLAREFFYACTFGADSRSEECSENRHLLDTVRNVTVGSSHSKGVGASEYWSPIRSVTKLLEIGVKFELHKDESSPLLDITFENGVMTIPKLIIPPNGESVLRNLIAYEQCAPRLQQCLIVSYVMLFSHLIKSTKDLDFLIQKGIILAHMSKEDTACLFNRLCIDSKATSFFYADLARRVNYYYDDRWLKRWIAKIKRDYLYNPSSIWSFSNAVMIILILTLTQTVYSVLSYYK